MAKTRPRTAKEMRFAAARRARAWADIADRAGDTETAQQMRDLGQQINRMRLTVEVEVRADG